MSCAIFGYLSFLDLVAPQDTEHVCRERATCLRVGAVGNLSLQSQ